MENTHELNGKIRKLYTDVGTEMLTDVYEKDDVKVVYSKLVEKREGDSCFYQKDTLKVYRGDKLVAEHHPQLDPYITVERNIVCMTSDEECWLYDLDSGKENTVEMPIVAFEHSIEFELNGEYPHKVFPNAFCVLGEGCIWGGESWVLEFEYYINRDTLECIDHDIWPQEEGYEACLTDLESSEDDEEEESVK